MSKLKKILCISIIFMLFFSSVAIAFNGTTNEQVLKENEVLNNVEDNSSSTEQNVLSNETELENTIENVENTEDTIQEDSEATNETLNEAQEINESTEETTNSDKEDENISEQVMLNALEENDDTVPSIKYQIHGEDYGWQPVKKDGETGGTVGESRRIEGLKIELENAPENLTLQYQAHGQGYGWQSWVNEGELGGTTGQSKRLEAIRIKLSNTDDYSVIYRVSVQDYGWLNWVENGEIAGTVGKSKRVEAIEIKIVKKGTESSEEDNSKSSLQVTYQGQGQSYGWQDWRSNGTIAGTVGESKTLEGIKIELINAPENASIRYKVQGQGYGWESKWSYDGALAGTDGESKRMEAIKIELVNMDDYSIEYRAQVEDYGWLDWVVDGEIAGTDGLSKRLEAIQIRIVKKRAKNVKVVYQAHGEGYGWQPEQYSGIIAGTTGKRLEGIKIKLENAPENAKILYQAHGESYGWQSWTSDFSLAGTTGQSKRLEAIRIKLENMDAYSIEYNAYVSSMGWQGWALDGEIAGTTGQSKQIEAIRIRIVPKVTEIRSRIDFDSHYDNSTIYKENTTITGWAMDNTDNSYVRLFVDGNEVGVSREKKQSVLDTQKGYGGEEKNPTPGFRATVDFSNYSTGRHTLTAKLYKSDGTQLQERTITVNVKPRITYEEGTYGRSGLSIKGDSRGQDLRYYRYGDGPNVFFATFAVHGWEDLYAYDGQELTKIAEEFKNKLVSSQDQEIADKWTIYIFPSVNPDGEYHGYTHNGPGRTSLYSAAPYNKGIDINRGWSTGYTRNTSNRNYNGTAPFQAYEAQALRDFLLSKRATNGQTVLVDLHGWLNETIGDNGIGSYYRAKFGISKHIATYGSGYLVNWARSNLGYNGRTARSCLVELPEYNADGTRYINATFDLLKGIV